MITANYYTIGGSTVGDEVEFKSNDLNSAKVEAVEMTGMDIMIDSPSFILLGDKLRRMIVSIDPH
jgi:hypothetical protein